MKIHIVENYEEMSKLAAEIIIDQVKNKPDSILGLATGSTPEGLYEKLIEAHKKGLDFSKVTSFNLDEYVGLEKNHPQSYHYFMTEKLFSGINIKKENTHFPSDEAEISYDEEIAEAGGLDLQLLGLGNNGHIAFNEPAEELSAKTGPVNLTESTIEANSRFFESKDQVPKKAITSGMATIMQAEKLLILASGPAKADVVKKLIAGDIITTKCPATLTLLHRDATLIVDKAAAGK